MLKYILFILFLFDLLTQHIFAQDPKLFYPSLKKLVTTKRPSFSSVYAWIQKYPETPYHRRFSFIVEKEIGISRPPLEILRWFEKNPPLFVEGAFAYAYALIAQKKNDQAQKVLSRFWTHHFFSKEQQKDFLKRFPSQLKDTDHQKRVEFLLFHENVEELIDLMTSIPFRNEDKDRIQAQIAVLKKDPQALRKIDAMLIFSPHDEGLLYHKMLYYHRNKDHDKAISFLFKSYDLEKEFPQHWGKIRLYYGRYLLERRRYNEALIVLSKHQLSQGERFSDIEWLRGWIETRFLNRLTEGAKRFEMLFDHVKTPISRSRMAFWRGEIASPQEANAWYQKAAQYPQTFYGQLANVRLNKQFSFPSLTVGKNEIYKRFWFRVLTCADIKDERHLLETCVDRLAEEIALNPLEIRTAILFLEKKFTKYFSARFSRKVLGRNPPLVPELYPLLSNNLKKMSLERVHLRDPFFGALVHSIINRESRFDVKALSPANAQGLMQMISSTAQKEIKRAQTEYKLRLKLTDLYLPHVNVTLGSLHLRHLLKRFGGHLLFSIAAYNAGESAVQNWLQTFGNPLRDSRERLWDWIETIPYAETRHYVQRVLENIAPYYARLCGKPTSLDILMRMPLEEKNAYENA